MSASFLAGFLLGLSLILAIGAQNAFVLRQGLQRQHIFVVCLVCALSDAILVSAGVAGFGALAKAIPMLETMMRYGGAAFLFFYGFKSFRAAISAENIMKPQGNTANLGPTVLTCLALTWLNPHVYLDTVVLLGAVSAQYPDKLAFAGGAVVASFTFFFSLGYGARLLDPLFRKPLSWRLLDTVVGLIMWGIALKLILWV